MSFTIEHLFAEHKFWENTKKKLELPLQELLMGSILKKRSLVLVNLTDTWTYCRTTRQRFDLIYAKVLAHELFHLIAMDEVQAQKDGEEWAIGQAIEVKPILAD